MIKVPLTKNGRIVLEARYLERDHKGRPTESPEDLFRRVADNIALADAKYAYPAIVQRLMRKHNVGFCDLWRTKDFQRLIKGDKGIRKTAGKFYGLMASLDFLPNSPTLFNAGRSLQQLAGCFVIPVEDHMNAIFEALRMQAIIHQSGGGTGFSFSRLRPRGDMITGTKGEASGPVSFMKIFDAATEQVKQGGKRRGANMGILRVDHPDIEEFARVKDDESMLRNFNISVAITDAFMRAVKKGTSYGLINPRTGKVVQKRDARKIFDLIARQAHKTADPGVIFIDTINKKNPTPELGDIESTNPCGEIPLLPYEACNLASINLSHFVVDAELDFERLKSVVWDAMHFLDNIIDMSRYPFPEITAMVHGNRKVGLGVMGFADMLIGMGVSYVSEEALVIAEQVMAYIDEEAKKASIHIAKERAVFPNFKGSIYDTKRKEDRVRNATRTAVAPTGTISIIAGCSSGIEPLFALAYEHAMVGRHPMVEVNPLFLRWAKANGSLGAKVLRDVKIKGSLGSIKGVPQEIKDVFVTAHEVPAEVHVKMQAMFQRHTDNAVSKTVNLPHKTTAHDIAKIYRLAYELGCKGISVYREGSKSQQVIHIGKAKN